MAAYNKQRRGTQCRGSEEQVIGSLTNYFRHRIRNRSSASEEDENEEDVGGDEIQASIDRGILHALNEEDEEDNADDENDEDGDSTSKPEQATDEQISRQQSSGRVSNSSRRRRVRTDSSNEFTNDEAVNYFQQIQSKKMFRPRSSCVFVEKDLMANQAKSVKRRGGISARGSIGDDEKDRQGFMTEFDPNEESILGRVCEILYRKIIF